MKHVLNQRLEYDEGLMLLDGEPFTGVGEIVDDKNQRVGEIEYRDGLEWGLKQGWTSAGQLDYEARFYRGVLHGRHREWHANGQLAEEGDYELGFLLKKQRWDEAGISVEEFELKASDPDYKNLQEYRRLYKSELTRQEPP